MTQIRDYYDTNLSIYHNSPNMVKKQSYSSNIRRLLKANKAMSINELSDELGGRARSSLFRDLQSLKTISSYTHAGKYRALESTVKFDSHGLWHYQDIGFTKHGTLKAAVVRMIEDSDIGYTHKELNNILNIKTHNTLKYLIDSNSIFRRHMPNNIYVYLHNKDEIAQKQYSIRLSIKIAAIKNISPPPQWATIEVLAEVIRCSVIDIDPGVVYQRIAQRGLEVPKETVENIFSFYEVKKKRT